MDSYVLRVLVLSLAGLEKLEGTLSDLEKCTRLTGSFLKVAEGKKDNQEAEDIFMKLQKALSKAKTLEACLLPLYSL